MLQGLWTSKYSPAAGGALGGKSYWVCTENWPDQNYPIDTNLFSSLITSGLFGGGSPTFAIIGYQKKVYYNDSGYSATTFSTDFQQAMDDAINSFPTSGVSNEDPIRDKTYQPSDVDVIDITGVFLDLEGDPLTISVQSNTDPSVATVNLVGNNLTITASSNEYNGSTTVTLLAEDTAHGESDTNVFVVYVKGNEWTGASVSPLTFNVTLEPDATDNGITTITSGIPDDLNFFGAVRFLTKDLSENSSQPNSSKTLWDEQFVYDVYGSSGSIGAQAGCESDGTYIYTTVYNAATICKFQLDGRFVESFTIPGVPGLRDLAYDGQYFYGGAASTTIYKMDFNTKTLEGEILSPVDVRAIAYDDMSDAFWVNNWNADMKLISRAGAVLKTITDIPICYGAAYDNYSVDGPYLWVNESSTSSSQTTLKQFDIVSGTATGVAYSYGTRNSPGGLFIQDGIVPGTSTIGALIQNEALYGFELCKSETWLTLSNESGTITPSGTHDVTLNFDATGLTHGTSKTASIRFYDEHLNLYPTPIDVTLNVLYSSSGGTFSLDNSTLEYGNVTVADTLALQFTLTNSHATEAMVGNITTISGYSAAEVAKGKNVLPYSVGASSNKTFDLLFIPDAAGNYNGNITITSSDPAHLTENIAVTGSGVVPDIDVPASLAANAAPDAQIIKNFDIDNLGLGNLDYSCTINYTSKVVVKGSGGPDTFGYKWTDSDEADGPVYSWVEISGIGTSLTLTDDGVSAALPLGFTFSYYGLDYTTIRVGANGAATFTGTSISHSNATIPTSNAPNALLSPFWDDLNPAAAGSGGIYYYSDTANGRFIIEWDGVVRYNTTEAQTFQIILYSSGKIVYQYADMQGTLNSATIGIENNDGSDGCLVVFNATYVKNNLAVQFASTPLWLSLDINSGQIAPSGTRTVAATCDATGLPEGVYTADIVIASNDPDESTKVLPVTFTVSSTVGIEENIIVSTELYQNYPNPFNPSTNICFSLANDALVELAVYNMTGQTVATLAKDKFSRGSHNVEFNASNLTSGMYYYILNVDGKYITRKMILIK